MQGQHMTNPLRDFPIIKHGGVLDVTLEALWEVQLDCFAGFGHTILKKDATPQGGTAWRENPERSCRTSGTFQMETLEFVKRTSSGLFLLKQIWAIQF
jgi:hypothetical protein